jgi:hypothetical protein
MSTTLYLFITLSFKPLVPCPGMIVANRRLLWASHDYANTFMDGVLPFAHLNYTDPIQRDLRGYVRENRRRMCEAAEE